MNLQELIDYLESLPDDTEFPIGFTYPHSYRGHYEQLAFEILPNAPILHMRDVAKKAIGQTYSGYKGGSYRMHEDTPVWLAKYGQSGGIRLSGRVLETLRTLQLPDQPEDW